MSNIQLTVRKSTGCLEGLPQITKISTSPYTYIALVAIGLGIAAACLFGILPPAALYASLGVGVISNVLLGIAITAHCKRETAAQTIQNHVRGALARERYVKQRNAIVGIQAASRGFIARHAFAQKKAAIQTIQNHVRGAFARERYVKQRNAAVKIQAVYRGNIARRAFLQKKEAAITIQKNVRSYLAQKAYKKQKAAAQRIQRVVRGHLARQAVKTFREARGTYFKGQVYRLMSSVLSLLEQDPQDAAGAMKETTKLNTAAFRFISAPLMEMVLQLCVEAGMTADQGKLLFETVRDKLGVRKENGDGTCDVRNDYLSVIALLLMRVDPSLSPQVQQMLKRDETTIIQWQSNAHQLLTKQFVEQFKGAISEMQRSAPAGDPIKAISDASIAKFVSSLEARVKGGDYSSFLSVFKAEMTPEEYRAHELRYIAHGISYNRFEIGQTDPDVGEVIFRHLGGGVNYFVSMQAQENKGYKLHFCCAGTHEPGGIARDLNPTGAKSKFDDYVTSSTWHEIAHAVFTKMRKDYREANTNNEPTRNDLEAIPFNIETHGHSLGGFDAQMFGLRVMEQMQPKGKLSKLKVTSVLMNTQNALRLNLAEAERYKELARACLAKGIEVSIHIGFVPYDVVQHAGSRMAGYGCEDLEQEFANKFKITIVKHHCEALKNWSACLTAGPHTAVSAATRLVFTEDIEARKRVLGGGGFGTNGTVFEVPIDAVSAVVKFPVWAIAATAAYFKAADSGGAQAIESSWDPGSSNTWIDIGFGGLPVEVSEIYSSSPPPSDEE